jgi:hypothetical protein
VSFGDFGPAILNLASMQPQRALHITWFGVCFADCENRSCHSGKVDDDLCGQETAFRFRRYISSAHLFIYLFIRLNT